MATILVVDDDKAIQEMLKDLLRLHDHDVHTCRDGKQVLAELKRHYYDLMILDVLVPHMNGFVLMEHIRNEEKLKDLPVIMISGIYRSRNHRADMTTKYGVVDYLDKPVSTDRLLDLVARALALPRTMTRQKFGKSMEELDAELEQLLPREAAALAEDEPVTLEKKRPDGRPTTKERQRPPVVEDKVQLLDRPQIGPATQVKISSKLVDQSAKHERQEVERALKGAFKAEAFMLQGTLGKLAVPAVLGKLWHQRASGGLLLRRDAIKKIIYLKEGNPVQVKSNLVSECLGQILLKERLITKAQCEKSVAAIKETGQKQGEILVQMGALTPKNLAFALDLQLETKLYETFAWETGEYRFNDNLEVVDGLSELPWTGPMAVAEGIRRTFREARLKALLAPLLDVRLELGGAIDDVAAAFPEKEQQAIATLALGKTTAQILGRLGLVALEAQRLVYTLLTLGILRPVE
ncbi:MAG: response regulator [Deltaproteobacteria bacterium]|nr:response regulator [Deltaproteobacteria bacterium]